MRVNRLFSCVVISVVTATALAVPAHAGGATASRAGDQITIVGSDGNDVISIDANVWDGIIDSVGITAGAGCDQISGTEVKCGNLTESTTANVSLGGGDDNFSWTASTGSLTVDGGPGNDVIYGGSAADTLTGGDGNDTIKGANGNDTIDGGAGNDNLTGGQDDDIITGGPGQDIVNADGENNYAGNWFGNDQVFVRDGERDVVTCGFGTDTVVADTIDVFDAEGSCESIDRAGGASASTGTSSSSGASSSGGVAVDQPSTSAGSITIKGSSSGRVSTLATKGYSFTLTTPVPCKATIGVGLAATEAKRVLGKNKVTMLEGQQGDVQAGAFPVTWQLPKKYVSSFKRARHVQAVVVFQCTTTDGQQATVTKVVNFK
jgi:hypothetical protein